MKEFWNENRRIIGKIILNQFGATFLGLMVIIPVYSLGRPWLLVFASAFAVFFYLFLLYNIIWERGGQDRIKVDGGRAERKPLTGLWIAIAANVPNLLIGLLIVISQPFKSTQMWAGTMNGISRVCALLWEGMYAGLVSAYAPVNPFAHVLDILPAIAVITFGYLLGLSNRKLLSPFELKQPENKENNTQNG